MVHQIQNIVTQYQLDLELAVCSHEGVENWNDEPLAIGHSASHADGTLQLTGFVCHRRQHIIALVMQGLAANKEALAGFREADMSGGSEEKPLPHPVLKLGYFPTHLRCGQTKFASRACKTMRLGDRNELINSRPSAHMAKIKRLSLYSNYVFHEDKIIPPEKMA